MRFDRALAHGVWQGTVSEIQGGRFQDGFLSAGASVLLGDTVLKKLPNDFTLQTAGRVVVGGTASVIGGGKFANGAYTAGFVYAYNHIGHMLAGTDAHRVLLNWLEAGTVDGPRWSGNIGWDGLFGGGRPDLLYRRDDGSFLGWEIKPDGSDAAARAQLQGYIDAAGDGVIVPGNSDRVLDTLPSSHTLGSQWFTGDVYYTYSSSGPGVITYQVNDAQMFDQIKRALNTKPKGLPIPFPIPLPGMATN